MIVDHKNKRLMEVVEGTEGAVLRAALDHIPGRENVQWVAPTSSAGSPSRGRAGRWSQKKPPRRVFWLQRQDSNPLNDDDPPLPTGTPSTSSLPEVTGEVVAVAQQSDLDPVVNALRMGLEKAIAEGLIPEAAEIATALAARAQSKQAPNVVKLSTRRPR
jgi:hypothetical protein